MNFEKILISADNTRILVDKGKIQPFHLKRIRKYYELLSWQISFGTQIPVEKFICSSDGFSQKKFYNLLNIPFKNENSWIDIYDIIPNEDAIDYYYQYIKNSLVIYVEASNTIKRIHNILNIPYIDITVHPIRFMDDHYFGISTNEKTIFSKMEKYKIDKNIFFLGAQLLKTQINQSPINVENNSALLIGQTYLDKSLIFNKTLLSLNNYIKEIEQIHKKYKTIYFAPHPYVKDRSIYADIYKLNYIKQIKENTYKYLSSNNIKCVCGISSSVLYEAYFFRKNVTFFKKSIYFDYENENTTFDNIYISIGKEVLQPYFWKDILCNINVKEIDNYKININTYPNQIRSALNDYWNYTKFDATCRTIVRSEILKSIENNKNNILN